VDLNYREPEVLLEVLELLLFYAARGALRRIDGLGDPGQIYCRIREAL